AALNLGVALANAGRPEEAEPVLEDAVALAPDDPEARTLLGTVRAALGKNDAAEADLSRALRDDPDSFEAARELGRLLHGIPGRGEEGTTYLIRAAKLASTNEERAEIEAISRAPRRP